MLHVGSLLVEVTNSSNLGWVLGSKSLSIISQLHIKVSLILIIRAVPLFPYVKFNPLVQKALMIREVIIEAMNFITLATTFK